MGRRALPQAVALAIDQQHRAGGFRNDRFDGQREPFEHFLQRGAAGDQLEDVPLLLHDLERPLEILARRFGLLQAPMRGPGGKPQDGHQYSQESGGDTPRHIWANRPLPFRL